MEFSVIIARCNFIWWRYGWPIGHFFLSKGMIRRMKKTLEFYSIIYNKLCEYHSVLEEVRFKFNKDIYQHVKLTESSNTTIRRALRPGNRYTPYRQIRYLASKYFLSYRFLDIQCIILKEPAYPLAGSFQRCFQTYYWPSSPS